MKLKTIASSSKGNAFILDNFLIDCGVKDVPEFEYILLTHVHGDHDGYFIEHLKKAKGWTTGENTFIEVMEKHSIYEKLLLDKYIKPEDLNVKTLNLTHDKACTGFLIKDSTNTYLHITDTAHVDLSSIECNMLSIEANHDISTLESCDYNDWLKSRIRNTHLNNEQAIDIAELVGAKKVNFIHMSENSNDVETLELELFFRNVDFEYTINGVIECEKIE